LLRAGWPVAAVIGVILTGMILRQRDTCRGDKKDGGERATQIKHEISLD
jgi:hypothetical protein